MSPPTNQAELILQPAPYETDLSELEIMSRSSQEESADENALEVANVEESEKHLIELQKLERTKIPKLSVPSKYSVLTSRQTGGGDQKTNCSDSINNRRNNFRKRKSLSLMEIQRVRKSSRSARSHQSSESGQSLVGRTSSRGESRCFEPATLQLRNNVYCVVDETENDVDPKLAGMRVFASIMLNAWRRRRDEVRRLNEELSRVKKGSIKGKNQIHVLSSLFKVEQKTNDDLSFRLRRCLEDQQKLQDMYNDLNKAYSALQFKLSSAEGNVNNKNKEIDDLNFLLGESKTNLFKAMSRERELESSLTNERRRQLELENEKNELISTVTQLEQNIAIKRELEIEMDAKCKEINNLKTQLETLDRKLKELKDKEAQVKEYQKLDMTQRKLIQELADRARFLEEGINNSLGARTLTFLSSFRKTTFQYSHLVLYFLLPMTPPPTQIALNTPKVLEKAFSFHWG